jgi:RimJ/RimL family protein N-acetyltransferase
MPRVRILTDADRAAVEIYLAHGADQAMLLRSNALAAGLVDHGRWREATYAGAEDNGRIVALAAHCWNGMLLLQAPVMTIELARLAVTRAGRRVSGLQGPWDQIVAARAALGLEARRATTESRDLFYSLEIPRLVVPESARLPGVRCQRSRAEDLPWLADWRVQFWGEALRASDSPALRAESLREMTNLHQAGEIRVLWVDGRPVSCYNVMARVPAALMIGNVWTPRTERGHRYAGIALALGLLEESTRGLQRAVLFTETGFLAARRTYQRLGFTVVGEYGFVVLSDSGAES